jgi:hypothetical protein
MNGYLRCLVDQYQRKFNKATGAEKDIYMEFLISLNKLKEYIERTEKPKEPQEKTKMTINDIPSKRIIAGFKGNVPEFIDYIRRLRE